VILDSKVATSSDGINWTFSDASGLTYSNFVVGKPGASASYFQNELGLLTTDFNNKYYFTGNGISYTSTPDLGLLFDYASNSQRRYAYSGPLKRLVVISFNTSGTKIGTYDFVPR
jgi:hypothetical protein